MIKKIMTIVVLIVLFIPVAAFIVSVCLMLLYPQLQETGEGLWEVVAAKIFYHAIPFPCGAGTELVLREISSNRIIKASTHCDLVKTWNPGEEYYIEWAIFLMWDFGKPIPTFRVLRWKREGDSFFINEPLCKCQRKLLLQTKKK